MAPCSFLFFQKLNVLVDSRAAQVTDPCKLGHIQLPLLVCVVVPKEARRKVLDCYLRPPDLPPFGSGIGNARTDSCPNHGKLQLAEHARHLQECLAHGVGLTASAVKGNASNDDQPQVLGSDDFDDFTELLCASG